MKREEMHGAVGKSISFRPFSLYQDAMAYGQTQRPRRAVSAVVCEALEAYLEQKGFRRTETLEVAEVLKAARRLGLGAARDILEQASRAHKKAARKTR